MRSTVLAIWGLISIAAEAAASGKVVACNAPSGTSALLEQDASIIIFGEYHGTNEMPELVGDVACAAATAGKSVTVALEIPATEEPALSAFLAGNVDESELLNSSSFWREKRDGRNSGAMLRLLTRLRELRDGGFEVDVLAVDAPGNAPESLRKAVAARIEVPEGVDAGRSFRDLHMAYEILRHVEKNVPSLTIFLVGSMHARRDVFDRAYLNVESGKVTHHLSVPAAAVLPQAMTLTLLITHSGGRAFALTTAGSGERPVQGNEPELREAAIVLAPFPEDAPVYDGRAFVGTITASRPAVARGKD